MYAWKMFENLWGILMEYLYIQWLHVCHHRSEAISIVKGFAPLDACNQHLCAVFPVHNHNMQFY